eukprot:Selendium_serpulae@DN5650_c0_g1_i1.p1
MTLHDLSYNAMRAVKLCGMSDIQIGQLLKHDTAMGEERAKAPAEAARRRAEDVRKKRINELHVTPCVKQIDTLAAEFPAQTNYLYLTYGGKEHDVTKLSDGAPNPIFKRHDDENIDHRNINRKYQDPFFGTTHSPDADTGSSPRAALLSYRSTLTDPNTVLVLGCGCYRIGSSVEFDWTAMSCVRTLRSLKKSAIMMNCNPETVSTDYDESDRLYFEDLGLESVLDVWDFEQPDGVVVSVGGQTPNNIALGLGRNHVRVLGTSVQSIDKAEDREQFSQLCDEVNVEQPRWSCFTSLKSAKEFIKGRPGEKDRGVGYPVLVRPSYVLSGAAMRVVTNDDQLKAFLDKAAVVSQEQPVVISKYIEDAKEVEMDGVAYNGKIVRYAISEHVENAGVHSGDASLILPAQKLYIETIRIVIRYTEKLAKKLKISGPFNIQFVCKNTTDVKVIECNLRASRTFPFISKTFNTNYIDTATRIMVGAQFTPSDNDLVLDYVGVKVPCFSFTRLSGSDPVLGVEMKSTGEVACFGFDKHEAFLKAYIAAGGTIPTKAVLVACGPEDGKHELSAHIAVLMSRLQVYATKGTYDNLCDGIPNVLGPKLEVVSKPSEVAAQGVPSAIDLICDGKLDLVIDIPKDPQQKVADTDGFKIRRCAMDRSVTVITDLKQACLLIDALQHKWNHDEIEAKMGGQRPFAQTLSWDEYTLAHSIYSRTSKRL